jgi:hypothetical protein
MSRSRLDSYTGYSITCALVWAALLLAARCGRDPGAQRTLRLACGAWWSGWLSASIARAAYPPPRPLAPAERARLRAVSLPLIGLGVGSAVRLIAGRRPAGA